MPEPHRPRPAPGKRRHGDRDALDRERSQLDFELAQAELEQLLQALDHDLWKQGLSGGGPAAARPRAGDEATVHQSRQRAILLAGAMTRGLQARIRQTVDVCATLSVEQRTGLAGLLRLPHQRRQAITALLRLPSTGRRALEVVFALPDEECAALAHFLHPAADQPAEPTLTMIDPSATAEDPAESTTPAEPRA
jgi:hypothetical protein